MDLTKKHSEITFQLIVESAPTALILVNKEGKISFSNNQAEKLFGSKKSELIGQSIERLIPARYNHSHPGLRDHFFHTTEARSIGVGRDLFALKRDGTEFPVEIGLNPIVTMDGTMVLAAIIDITERKKAEEHKALFASIVDSSDDAILSKTLDGVITSWNKGAETLFGYTGEEIIGKNVSILIPPDRTNEEPEIIKKIRNGEHVHHYETQRIRKDESLVFISLTVSPIKDKYGKIIGASKIARDITERKLAEEKILKGNRLYAFLSGINQTTVHVRDEQFLLNEVCKIATAVGKFEMAWIGFYNDGGDSITLTAQSNATEYDLSRFRLLKYEADGPLAKVLKTGIHCLGNETEPGPSHEIWEEYSKKRGLGDYIILPIHKSGKVIGAFTVYSTVSDFFDDEEIALLKEASGDISFALDNFERERLIAQSEVRLKGAQQMAHLGDWELDLKTKKVSWSEEQYRIYGLEPYSITPSLELALNFVHPDDQKRVREEIDDSFAHVMPLAHFRRIILANGEIHHIYATALYDFDELNRPIRFHGTTLDVTDIVEKEENLKKSEERYKYIFDNNPMPMFVIDKHTYQFLNVNKAAVNRYGYSREEFLNMTAVDIRRDEEKQRFLNLERTDHSSLYESGNWEHIKKDGTRILVEIHAQSVSFEGKEARLILVIDVTKKKKAEQALKKSEANMKSIFENPDISYILLDTHLKIVSFNKRANEGFLREFQGPLVEGKNFLDYVPEERKIQVGERYLGVVEGKSVSYENSFNRPDGSIFWLYSQLAPVKDDADSSLGMIMVITDISEKKKAELDREKLISDIILRNKDLEQFTYIVSHNLRAPVANIIGTTDILQMDDLDAGTAKDMLSNLSTSVNLLDEVIKDLNYILQVKRQVNDKNETVKFSRIVEDITASISNLIKNENVELITDFEEVDEFYALKSYIYSFFYNLISNSIKYRRPEVDPVIEIKSALVKNKIVLTFKDNGLGIDLEKKGGQVFGLYKRFHLHKEGKGMGLYMTKSQVEAMGGNISISSKVNEGTEFIIEFDTNS